MSEKLQKVLARAGIGSRREMERVIAEGRVSINGEIATLGVRVGEGDTLRVDGKQIRYQTAESIPCRVLVYNKPEGEICSRSDPEHKKTVFDRLPRMPGGRWIAVGRLDINTSGLLLFTTDGELANRLMHPSHEIEREYAVRVFGEVTDGMAQKLRTGVQLEDGPAKFSKLSRQGGEGLNRWYHVTLSEGRNREVRRMWEAVEVVVSRLTRIRYGDIKMPRSLPLGGWAELDSKEVNYLRKTVKMGPIEARKELPRSNKVDVIKSNRIRKAVRKAELRRDK
ncbi:23S rRNA pseudouridine(2605) synthase RluB [Algibacillus agarilyticus]|uniref:23S rRNA pseudouridine(2605) synthase RluB n=1 Tax=Algibacillus agarilyticus TaxID=2234133 RepID=UPI000DD0D79A|nr:23S rRNA pseudouridine(2605) synthase RluB [Algibacillus agarilyticus]